MDIEKISIHESGIVGTLFQTKSNQRKAGVVVISGSEGGIPEYIAQRFIRDDLIIFALGYFGLPGLPSGLENIPLEYFQKAIAYFASLPQVDPSRIGLIGNSRGGELVLLLSAKANLKIKAIAALVPSIYVNGGFPHPNMPAWTLESKPIIPFLRGLTSENPNLTELEDLKMACQQGIIPLHLGTEADPYRISDLFRAREKAVAHLEELEIPIELISVPVLILSAEDDGIWPSGAYAKKLQHRVKNIECSAEIKSYTFSKAGHGIAFPYFREFDKALFHSVGNFWCHPGGDPNSNQKASEETERKVLDFLQKALG